MNAREYQRHERILAEPKHAEENIRRKGVHQIADIALGKPEDRQSNAIMILIKVEAKLGRGLDLVQRDGKYFLEERSMSKPSLSKAAKLAQNLGGNVAASIKGSPDCAAQSPADRRFVDRHRDDAAARISLERIGPDPRQPRKTFDAGELKDLADSLRAHGQLQPCVVRWDGVQEKYFVVAGERRYRAAKLAGLKDLRCVVWDLDRENDEVRIRELQLIENLLRVDLPPLEQAEAYRELMKSSGLNGKVLAEKLHINPGTVSRALALLKLPAAVRDGVERGVISPSVAYEVSKAPKEKQKNVAAAAVDGKLTRDQVANQVKALKPPAGPSLDKCTIPKSPSAEPVIASNISPYIWSSPNGPTVRISPRPGATIFGIISIANILREALTEVEAQIEAEVKAPKANPKKGEPLASFGLTEESIEQACTLNKWESRKTREAVNVKPVLLNGRPYVWTDAIFGPDGDKWHFLPLWTAEEYKKRFPALGTRLDPGNFSRGNGKYPNEDFYLGVLVRHGKDVYVMGSKSEKRTLIAPVKSRKAG